MGRRSSWFFSAALFVFLPAAEAAAQGITGGSLPPALERVLVMKDGAIYRGEVIELVPREYIILKLHSGVEKRFAWSAIDKQSVPGGAASEPLRRESAAAPAFAPSPRPAPPPPTRPEPVHRPERPRIDPQVEESQPPRPPRSLSHATRQNDSDEETGPADEQEKPYKPPRRRLVSLPPDLQPYRDNFVFLRLRSPEKDIRLEYISDRFESEGLNFGLFWPVSLESWRVACEYPCGEYVYRNATFRVTGPDIVDSPRFTLTKTGPDIELHVKPGRPAAKGFGITLDILGGAALLVGAGILVTVGIQSATPDHGPLDNLLLAGLISTVGGGAVLAGGIALTVAGKTKISVARRPPAVSSPPVEQAID